MIEKRFTLFDDKESCKEMVKLSSERFMVDTVGSVVDMWNHDFYDYPSDLVPLLNELNDENEQLKGEKEKIINTIKTAYENEQTDLGKPILKQLMENIQ